MPEDKPHWKLLADFEPAQFFSPAHFNASYFESLEELEPLLHEIETLGRSERQSLISRFLETRSENSTCRPRAEKIESLLAGADVQILRQDKLAGVELNQPMAVVHDWSFTENRARSHSNIRGPKSAPEMYKLLRSKVCHSLLRRTHFRAH